MAIYVGYVETSVKVEAESEEEALEQIADLLQYTLENDMLSIVNLVENN